MTMRLSGTVTKIWRLKEREKRERAFICLRYIHTVTINKGKIRETGSQKRQCPSSLTTTSVVICNDRTRSSKSKTFDFCCRKHISFITKSFLSSDIFYTLRRIRTVIKEQIFAVHGIPCTMLYHVPVFSTIAQ